jgi:hypothetical protein
MNGDKFGSVVRIADTTMKQSFLARIKLRTSHRKSW